MFSQANVMMRFFFGLALSFFLIVLIYFIWMIKDVRRENLKMDEQLKNVQYMLEVERNCLTRICILRILREHLKRFLII